VVLVAVVVELQVGLVQQEHQVKEILEEMVGLIQVVVAVALELLGLMVIRLLPMVEMDYLLL
jgi:hypothetical protein